jgi:hypothetical protein
LSALRDMANFPILVSANYYLGLPAAQTCLLTPVTRMRPSNTRDRLTRMSLRSCESLIARTKRWVTLY